MGAEGIRAYIPQANSTFIAGGTITKGIAVKPDSTAGQVVAAGAGERAIGIANMDSSLGKTVTVTMLGGTEATAGAAIATIMSPLVVTTGGKLIAATTDKDKIVGFSVGVAGADGDIIPVIVVPSVISA